MSAALSPVNAGPSTRSQAIELYNKKAYAKALPLFQDIYQKSNETDYEAGTLLAWCLAHTYQLHAAEQLFATITKRGPESIQAFQGHWFTLNSMGRSVEAINIIKKNELDRYKSFSLILCRTFLEIGNIQDAKESIDLINETLSEKQDPSLVLKLNELLGEFYSGLQHWKQSALLYRESISKDKPGFNPVIKLIRAISRYSKSQKLDKSYKFCEAFIESDLAPVWTKYQLARFNYCSDVKQHFEKEPEQPIHVSDDFTAYAYLHSNFNRRLWNETEISKAKKHFKTPVVTHDQLLQNIKRFKAAAAKLIEDRRFDIWDQNFKAFQGAFGNSDWQPTFILSTGRCGTEALYDLLKQSDSIIPYHPLAIRSTPMDRNHLLYRIIEGKFDDDVLYSILKDYLESRSAEYLHALRSNKTIVIVNHFDTIFAPFCAVLFPQSRFIHLSRKAEATFKSFYGKNQWRNRQLQHWLYNPTFPDGRFEFFQDSTLPIEAQVAWYFYITKSLSECLFETLPEQRHTSLVSDNLFEKQTAEFDKLRSILPETEITETAIRNSFGIARNSKDELLHVPLEDLENRSRNVTKYIQQLEQTGTLQPL